MGTPRVTLDTVTDATFAEYVGERFRLHVDPAHAMDVELIEVSPSTPRAADPARALGRRAPFSITFRGPTAPVAPQRIYRIEHGRFGSLELFLVPIGPDERGMRYEAVIA